jgi:hypothetical protein
MPALGAEVQQAAEEAGAEAAGAEQARAEEAGAEEAGAEEAGAAGAVGNTTRWSARKRRKRAALNGNKMEKLTTVKTARARRPRDDRRSGRRVVHLVDARNGSRCQDSSVVSFSVV